TTSGGTPVTLLASGFDAGTVAYTRHYSPDLHAMLYETPDLKMVNTYDFGLVSLVSPATPTVFLVHPYTHPGDYFTADSAYALLLSGTSPPTVTTVAAAPTGGSSPIPISSAGANAI